MELETWHPLPGYGGLYEVSDIGRVWSCRKRKTLSLVVNKRGYVQCNLYRDGRVKNHMVHRLVALAFFGKIPSGLQVNHKNGVKTDNRVENLELVTPEQNRQQARDKGLVQSRKGEANPAAKLTEDDVRAIRRLRAEGVTAIKVAQRFGVTERVVFRIQHRKSWTHLK